jgi:hypothetical protein
MREYLKFAKQQKLTWPQTSPSQMHLAFFISLSFFHLLHSHTSPNVCCVDGLILAPEKCWIKRNHIYAILDPVYFPETAFNSRKSNSELKFILCCISNNTSYSNSLHM